MPDAMGNRFKIPMPVLIAKAGFSNVCALIRNAAINPQRRKRARAPRMNFDATGYWIIIEGLVVKLLNAIDATEA